MIEWIDDLAEAFAQELLSDDEADRLLRVARDVAHRVERKGAPLAAFLMGMDVVSRMEGGVSRDAAINDSILALEALLPSPPVAPTPP